MPVNPSLYCACSQTQKTVADCSRLDGLLGMLLAVEVLSSSGVLHKDPWFSRDFPQSTMRAIQQHIGPIPSQPAVVAMVLCSRVLSVFPYV